MTRLSWVALHSMAHSFIELCKSLRHKAVILEGDQEINMRWKEHTEELYKKDLNETDYYNGVISYPEPDILKCKVKWALRSTAVHKVSGCNEIPAELFKSVEDDAIKVLHSLCQQIWKTQQWPQDCKKSIFIPMPKKDSTKECANNQMSANHCTHLPCQ